MKHHAWVSAHLRPVTKPPITLGWTQFALILIVIAAVLVLTGAVILPF